MFVDGSIPIRTQFSETVLKPWGPNGSLIAAEGVLAIPYAAFTDGSDLGVAHAWAERDPNSSIAAASTSTDESGTVAYYLDAGDYNIHFSDTHIPSRFDPYIRGFSSVPSGISADFVSLQSTFLSMESRKWTQHSLQIDGTDVVNSASFQAYGDIIGLTISGETMVMFWYEAIWSETVVGSSRAAIIVTGPDGWSEVSTYADGAVAAEEAGRGATNIANQWGKLVSCPIGLVSTSAPAYTTDGINGQANAIALASTDQIAYSLNSGTVIYNPATATTNLGGPCCLLVDPGPGDVPIEFSVQYKIATGTASVKNRVMHLMVAPF